MKSASPQSVASRLSLGLEDARRAVQADPLFALLAVLVLVPCLMLFAITVESLAGPLYGIHEWRQGWTYSVAYAFAHEGASFFFPRHAWRDDLTGIVGMEPPIYPYLVGQLMRVLGDSASIGRWLNFLLFLGCFGMQARQLGARMGKSALLGYVAAAAFCPALLCEFRMFQPDPMMASFSVLAAVYFQRTGETGEQFWRGLACYSVALLSKPIAICILPALWLFSVLGKARPTLKQALLRGLAFVIPLALMFAWDKWANHLVATYMGGNSLISIDHDPKLIWASIKNSENARFILLGLLETYTSHVVLFPAVLVGIPLSLSKELRAWGVPFLAWTLGMIAISLAYSGRYYANWYYLLLFVPPFLFFTSVALRHVFDVVTTKQVDGASWCIALGVVAAGVFVHPLLSDVPWDHLEQVDATLAVHVRRGTSLSGSYWAVLVCGAMFAAALSSLELQRQLPRKLTALALAGSGAWSMMVPFQDVKQTVRFYTWERDWQQGHVDNAEIRAAVDRYSSYADRFLVIGSNPALLVRALRVGYADEPHTVDARTKAYYRQRKVRFAMTFAEYPGLPAGLHGAELLAQGPRWMLWCIEPGSCPPLAKP